MTRSKLSDPENATVFEINQQVQVLHLLTSFYCTGNGRTLLERVPACSRVLFAASGNGVEFSHWAARQCLAAGLDARAVETGELAGWPETLLHSEDLLVLLCPQETDRDLLQKFGERALIFAAGRDGENTPQGTRSLPLLTDGEFNPLTTGALYWLLCRQLIRRLDGSEAEKLNALRQRAQLLLEGRGVLQEQWRKCLFGMDRLALFGRGSQAPAAAQTARTLSINFGVQNGLFQSLRGLDECSQWIGPGWGVICFETPSEMISESESVFSRLQTQGARCIRVIEGFPQVFSETPRPGSALDAELMVFLNLISGQIMAREYSSL